MPDILLGVDVGTYSSKGVLTTVDGTVLKTHVVEHGMEHPKPGWAEQDADAVWWADVQAICQKLLDGNPYTGEDVAGVGVSAIGPCVLPLDGSGKPLRKGILYGVDARASEEIELLNRALGEEEIFEFSGMALTSQAIGPKILWIRRHEPEVWKETRYLTTASSYLVYKLTGEHVMDRHTASHYMPLIDIHTLEWSNRFADHVAPLELLPRLAWSDEKAGEVTSEAAARTGLKPGTPVVVGAVDALSEAVSVGVTRPGDLMIMYGSTTFFILMLDKPVPDPRTWTTAGPFHGQYALAAGMATTGSLTRWFRDQFARDLPSDTGYDTLFASLGHTAPGAEGLIMLPYFSGERTPINDSKARGVVAGLTLTHTREHLFRAALEGVAYGIKHNLDTFRAMGIPIRRVVAVGGGTKNNVWPQIVSNVAKIEQYMPERTIGASLGNAFLAGLAVDLVNHQDLPGWIGTPQLVKSDSRLHSLYESGYQDYLDLYTHTREVVHRLGKRD